MTSKQGILNWCFSANALSQSPPLALVFDAACVTTVLLRPLSAVLARDPPVPLSAVIARAAVSNKASVKVELPLRNDDSVSVADAAPPCHRGSNQSALKSKSENMRTNSNIEQ